MEDLLDSQIGDVGLKTVQREFYKQPAKKENKIGNSEDGDHQKNSITIIHHQKPDTDPKDLEKLNIEGIPLKEECVQRRSTELITAVQSYTDPPDEEHDPTNSAFDLTDAAMTAQLMDMFENEILYSCCELDTLLSEDEELRMSRKPSTSLGRS